MNSNITCSGVLPPVDPKNPTHYVDNKAFYQALVEYRASCEQAEAEGKPRPMVTEYIGECFLKIARGVAMKHNFRNYSYINDMISSGVEVCLKYVLSFNPEKSNSPFSYFTQAVWFAFLHVIDKEHRQQDIKRMTFLNSDVDTFELHTHDESGEFSISINDYINSLGEDKLEKKALKQKVKQKQKPSVLENFYEDNE